MDSGVVQWLKNNQNRFRGNQNKGKKRPATGLIDKCMASGGSKRSCSGPSGSC